MKSRRHRAIDKAWKDIPMLKFKHRNRVKKKNVKRELKRLSKRFYKNTKEWLCNKQSIEKAYGIKYK